MGGEEEKNEFKNGWCYVAGAFVGISGGFASLYFYTAGLFIKPLAATFDWSRGQASLGSLAILAGNVVAMPIAGRLVDRFGEVRVAFLSAMALSLCFALLGVFTTSLTSFLALILLLTVLSAGSNSISYNRVIVRHFIRRRGLALGLALTGTGFGAAVVPAFLAPYIAHTGWRAGYFVLAALVLPLATIAAFLMRGSREASEMRRVAVASPSILRHRAFYTIGAIIFLASSAVLGTTMHIVPMLTDRGADIQSAGLTASVLGLTVIAGRIFTGYLLDRWDAGYVTAGLFVLVGLGMLLLWSAIPDAVLPGAMLVGLGVGTEGDLLAYLLGRRFPVTNFGSIYGAIFAVHAFGAGIGGYIAGLLFDRSGGYGAWLLLAAGSLFAAACIAFITEKAVKPVSV